MIRTGHVVMPHDGRAPIVVGVDGSTAARGAAVWAAQEAHSRGLPLRLVAAVDFDTCDEMDDADRHLRDAEAAISACGVPVRCERVVDFGAPGQVLARLGSRAAMVCIGARSARSRVSQHRSVASTLFRTVPCPVAVIRRELTGPASEDRWIVAALRGQCSDAQVLRFAVDESRRRRAAVLALTPRAGGHGDDSGVLVERLLESQGIGGPDVEIWAQPAPHDVVALLLQHPELDQLLVAAHDHEWVGQLMHPESQGALDNSNCSLVVLPPPAAKDVTESAADSGLIAELTP